MTRDPVYIAGIYEHPIRDAPDKSTIQLHAEVMHGALEDAGLTADAVDGFFTGSMTDFGYHQGPMNIVEYLDLDTRYVDVTDHGGSSYVSHIGHAAAAIRDGQCDVAVVTLAGRPRQWHGWGGRIRYHAAAFESIYGTSTLTRYGMAMRRHMHEYGTTPEQLAAIKVAASSHAQHNEHAYLPDPVTVEEVVSSPIVADPLRRMDCCVVTDGGGAFVMVSADVRSQLERTCVEVLGTGEYVDHQGSGHEVDLTTTGARRSGPRAFEDAGLGPEHIEYASIYDSFTITVLETIEDLGFCEKGYGGPFVEDGALEAPNGDLPFNTDGGGLSNNHPSNRGGVTKVIEAVRQLRDETPEAVAVQPDIALAHGTGGGGMARHQSATAILGREDR
ncbi:MAG: thiolase domain-containing protein [Natrialbaceae archaeon]|nr:thiolase domain-containing protein [Natrialbaceae archaeon]